MSGAARPLRGLRVGLSVAGGADELARRGFTESGLNRLTVRLARALLAEGATLAFGHDWRPGGVMEAIANIALDYQPAGAPSEAGTPILNFLPWDETASSTDPALLTRLQCVVEVIPAGLPAELRPLETEALRAGRGSEEWRYLRARGLTHLRRRLVESCQARVALGGKLTGYDGRWPGIVEEVYLSCAARQPVYLAGLLGGAAELLGRFLLGGESPAALRQALAEAPLAELYTRRAAPTTSGATDGTLHATALVEHLAGDDSRDCLRSNGLTGDETRALLHTHLEEEAVSLILRGLKQTWNPQTRSFQPRASTA